MGATTFSMMTFSITISIMELIVPLSMKDSQHYDTQHSIRHHYAESVIMMCVAFSFCYAECRFVRCHYAECRYAGCRYAECRYAGCHYAECRYAGCCYAE